jgi:ankyrin repeat protein
MGCSPIWIAAGYNHLNCLKYLVEKLSRQADDDVKYILETNDSGDSPFLAAASRGNVDICKYFLKYSTEKGEFTKVRLLRTANKAGDTPLKVAVAGGHDIDLLKLLLEADASISQTESANFIPCIDRKNNLGLSPLIIACERNLPSIVELLIAFGADVNIRDSKGRSALAVAAFCGCEDVVKFLTKSPAVATLLNESDDAGSTPLWLACRTGNLKMVELLIEAGADETIADNEGLTPKDVASKYKKVKVDEYFQNRSTR